MLYIRHAYCNALQAQVAPTPASSLPKCNWMMFHSRACRTTGGWYSAMTTGRQLGTKGYWT